MRKKITDKTKFITVINPNNPTGALYSDKVLKQIVDLAGEYDLFVLSDEIYDLMSFEGTHHSPASMTKDVPVKKEFLNSLDYVSLQTIHVKWLQSKLWKVHRIIMSRLTEN